LPFVIGCVHLRCGSFVVAFKVDAAKIETARRKEHIALRELDLAEWTVRESKDETASAVEVTHDADGKVQLKSLELDQNTSRVHNFIMAFFDYSGSADCDDSNGGDDDDEYGETDDDSDSEEGAGETDAEPHSGFEEWLCERKISWLERRIRKRNNSPAAACANSTNATSGGGSSAAAGAISTKNDTSGGGARSTYEPISGTAYIWRGNEKVEAHKALAIMQNDIDHPSTGRRARYILRKVRAPLSNHDLRRSNYYAKSFGGKVGVCFFTVTKILNMDYCPPGRTATPD